MKNFFSSQKPASLLKTRIVVSFFRAWSRVMVGHQGRRRPSAPPRLGYVDLFAGPGRYDDGAASTPLAVLSEALANPTLCRALACLFNEADSTLLNRLRRNVEALPNIERLQTRPHYTNLVLDSTTDLDDLLIPVSGSPSLFFVDPWGYKGVSLRLLSAATDGFGCDLILFFNSRRIIAALSNPLFSQHMHAIYGADGTRHLVEELESLPKGRREARLVQATAETLSRGVAAYVRHYRFVQTSGATSHYLFYFCKSAKGHDIMGNIMATCSATRDRGIPSFSNEPPPEQEQHQLAFESFFDETPDPIQVLASDLERVFARQSLTVRELIERHGRTTTRYVSRNYKDALLHLEASRRIMATPSADKRPRRAHQPTLADSVTLTFPDQEPP